MTLTVALALLVTPSFGLLAAELRDPNAERAHAAQQADLALRADLLEQGLLPMESNQPDVARLAKLGIEVFAPDRGFRLESGDAQLTGVPSSRRDQDRALATLATELGRYPVDFLGRARLHRLLLCAELHEGTQPIPSLPNYHGALLIDVDADARYLRRLVHHEIFHFADYADDDQLSRDPAWAALNDRYFVYGSGGRFSRRARCRPFQRRNSWLRLTLRHFGSRRRQGGDVCDAHVGAQRVCPADRRGPHFAR